VRWDFLFLVQVGKGKGKEKKNYLENKVSQYQSISRRRFIPPSDTIIKEKVLKIRFHNIDPLAGEDLFQQATQL
jgi:hypothetical protein